MRVPLVFAGPGVPEGHRSAAYVYLFDIFATLCELTGTPRPSSIEGESLVAAMNDGTERVRDTLYFAYISSQRAVKNRTHKLIEYAVRDRRRQIQLFDLENDPWETHNLAEAPGSADTVAELRTELLRYRDDWEAGYTGRGSSYWTRYG